MGGSPSQVLAVYLIHPGGFALASRLAPGVRTADEDLLAANLRVLLDFLRRARLGGGGSLTTIASGDLTLCMERGRYCDLAALVRGQITESLRTILRSALRRIEAANRRWLVRWNGEPRDVAGFNEALGPLFQGA